jgi:hypothetical protein
VSVSAFCGGASPPRPEGDNLWSLCSRGRLGCVTAMRLWAARLVLAQSDRPEPSAIDCWPASQQTICCSCVGGEQGASGVVSARRHAGRRAVRGVQDVCRDAFRWLKNPCARRYERRGAVCVSPSGPTLEEAVLAGRGPTAFSGLKTCRLEPAPACLICFVRKQAPKEYRDVFRSSRPSHHRVGTL